MAIRERKHTNERLVVLLALGVATAICVALLLFRELRYEAFGYRFLFWNLFLAWIPLLLSLWIYDRYRRGASVRRLLPASVLWVLFLPNAPYILTDFVHLSRESRAPLWFDGAVLSACAWTGLLLGFVSLYLLHVVSRHRYGATAAWLGVAGTLALVSAGVCLGRFWRWNSWDPLVRPRELLTDLAAAAEASVLVRGVGLVVLMTLGLVAMYFCFYVLVGSRLDARASRAGGSR